MRFNDDGTINLAGQTLRRPTIGELWDFADAALDASAAFNERKADLHSRLPEEGDVPDGLAEEVKQFTRYGLLEALETWYRELFVTLGQSDPGEVREWTSELLDVTIPAQIINDWKHAPKASGEATQTPTQEPPTTTTSD